MSRDRGQLLRAAGLLLLLPAACTEHRAGAAAVADERLIASAAGPIELTESPLRVALAPRGERTLAAELDALEPDRRIYLVVRDLRAADQPGVLYHLYLDLPGDAAPNDAELHHVGTLNFFAASPLAGEESLEAAAFRSFDISEVARALRARGLPAGPTTVTIRPQGSPEPGARPVIGRLELVVQ